MTEVIIALVVVLLGFFAFGSGVNVRRGNAAMKWLQGGLKQIGDRASVKWIGTTAVQLGLAQAKPPFQEAVVVVFLEPRDLPWLWAASRFHGRRDTLILRGRLARPPAEDVELLDRESWSGRDALRSMKEERWSVREPASPDALSTFFKYETALARADAFPPVWRGAGVPVRRLSVRRNEPHLQVHTDLPAASVDAAGFFRTVRELAELASRH
ncbi:MAG TPA: hypothetical protein VLH41_02730 [Thermoanaerobaculia bacterium]|nr:hypothetical protein [Thermoanaerobaculia bacterium]